MILTRLDTQKIKTAVVTAALIMLSACKKKFEGYLDLYFDLHSYNTANFHLHSFFSLLKNWGGIRIKLLLPITMVVV